MNDSGTRRSGLFPRWDQVVSASLRATNWAKIGWLGATQGPLQMWRRAERFPWLLQLLRIDRLHQKMTADREGRYREACAFTITEIVSGLVEMLEGIFERPERVVLHEDLVPPEILFGMGLEPWMAELLGILVPMVDPTGVQDYIDRAENEGIPADLCSLPKSTMGLVLQGHMPPPVAIVTSNMPCDGGMAQYALLQRELGAPMFSIDAPHGFYDDRAVDYGARELSRLIAWLEERTPARMDWDRMREVCEERNRAMAYELDLWDMLCARPAPLAAEAVSLPHLMFAVARPGTRRATKVFRRIAELARRNLDDGVGAVPDERHRVVLWNPPTLIFSDLFAWAEPRFGVSMVMDMLTYHHHPYIDTRTPETMLRDLARIVMQGPMARHTRGPAENFFGDLFQIVERFQLDMIWMAGHIGCKNTQALNGIFREKCRERDVPLLIIDYDLSDPRVVPAEDIRRQVEVFMTTVMGARE